MTTMQEDKGTDYVASWPRQIAHQLSCSAQYVITAINTVTGSTLPCGAAYSDSPLPEVAALSPAQTKAVVAEVQRALREIADHKRTHCHYCGLPLDSGSSTDFFGARACSGCS